MKTKLITLLSAGLLLGTHLLHAQLFDGGVIAGVSAGNVKMSDMNNTLINTANGSGIVGYEAGLFARLHLSPFYIKPMGLIHYEAGQVNFNYKDGSSHSSNFDDGKLEVPVLLGIHFLHIINVEAGPVYNWVFMANTNGDNELKVEPSGFGYRVGANVELWRLFLGISYQGLANKSSGSSTTTFQVPNELFFNVAINIGRHWNHDRDENH